MHEIAVNAGCFCHYPGVDFEGFCQRLAHLRIDRAKPPPKPYKPLLLIAVVLLIAKRKIQSPAILLDSGLKSAFEQLLARSFPNWPFRADVKYPFRHLENDGIWRLIPIDEAIDKYEASRAAGGKARDLLQHVACAMLDPHVFDVLATSADARLRMLSILLDAYDLPAQTSAFVLGVLGGVEEIADPGRPALGTSWTERALEEYLVAHWHGTPFARMGIELSSRKRHGYPARQVLTPVNAIDLLGFRERDRTWWVFELKRGRPPEALIGQISRYLGWIVTRGQERGEDARGVILAEDADHKLTYAVRAHDRLGLWVYDSSLAMTQVA